ncbi:MAG: ADP-ribosylglycohydrolase family protein [Nitrospinae bacterium]|nr:ADP-ribosylglycohydrolase family protein [Nitrospinota bacterium]
MGTNRETLNWLCETHQIDLQQGPLFDHPPPPLPQAFDFGRIEGMILGLAIGDALGTTLEFQPPGSFTPIMDPDMQGDSGAPVMFYPPFFSSLLKIDCEKITPSRALNSSWVLMPPLHA